MLAAVLIALALALPDARAAQPEAAHVRGIVRDGSGRVVADVAVTLLDGRGVRIAEARTDANGRFALAEVAPGTYTVLAGAPMGPAGSTPGAGGSPQQSDARVVVVQSALPIEVELRLAAHVSESLSIESPLTPSVTTRMTLAGAALRDMPTRLRSRGLQDVLVTLPGWASEDNGLLHVRGVDDGFLYVRDGVPIYDRLDALFGIAPDPESIETVHVLTGYTPPEFGLKSGAVIEVQSLTTRRAGWMADLEAGLGGQALRSARTMTGGPIGSRADLGVSVAAERSDRFLDPVHPDNLHNRGGVLSSDAHLTVVGSADDRVRLNGGVARSRYDVPHGELQEPAGQDQRQRLWQDTQSGSWQRLWSSTVVSQVAFYHRHLDANLFDSPEDTPITAWSDRRYRRLGALASVTHQRGRHTLKGGLEVARVTLGEDFRFGITDDEAADALGISEAAAAFTAEEPFRFDDEVGRTQWSFYAQDTLRATDRLTIDVGVRFDRTRLLVPASQWSPRLGAAYAWRDGKTTMRASVNRFFQPPQPEHLLLSSSAAARALSPFADDDDEDAGGAEIEPERQTAWEVGLEHWFAGTFRLDVAHWGRRLRNVSDPNVFFGTTIIFPNSVARGRARGTDVRLELPRYRGVSAYVSYTNTVVTQEGPINGGLFLEEELIAIGPGTRFTPDHDQRNVGSAGVTYHHTRFGSSISLTTRYASGTPLEVGEDDLDELMERPGADLVDFARGRVRPRTVVDLSLSQTLRRGSRADAAVRVALLNVANARYALNFGNPFSGTHFGAPRTVVVELRLGVR